MSNIRNHETLFKDIVSFITMLNFDFIDPPLILGGMALEYYGIRKCGYDFDCMVSPRDWIRLKEIYPNNINLFGGKTEQDVDATINVLDFDTQIDLISTLSLYNYDFLEQNSIDIHGQEKAFKIMSKENLYLVKSLGYLEDKDPKCEADTKLLVKYILKEQYKK